MKEGGRDERVEEKGKRIMGKVKGKRRMRGEEGEGKGG